MDAVGKQAVVTGGGQGFGLAIVETLTERGWTVWAADINQDALKSSPAAHAVEMDVTDPSSVKDVIDRVDASGGVDALINNAGIYPNRTWEEHDSDLMHRVFDVNVVGTLLCSQAAAHSMIKRHLSGSIVNVTSLAFYKGYANALAYAASKGGVIGLTRSLAIALGPHGIRVNALAPGLMSTVGTSKLITEGTLQLDRLEGDGPGRQLPGVTTAANAAGAIAMLLSDDANQITGQVLAADGGTYFI
jgi:NAD(P)-dependent dehydrogenase (short-subunit alcohol dehydrogenase family)